MSKTFLLAECGSTKCDWYFIENGAQVQTIQTAGFNPNYHTSDQIINAISAHSSQLSKLKDSFPIYFYGSGCGDKIRQQRVEDALKNCFPNAPSFVHSDLTAAAYATCGSEVGLVVILGTGSNTLLFDGTKIEDQIANLGFICGDEGSGSHIGKKLIQSYFYRKMPFTLRKKFGKYFKNGRSTLLDHLYQNDQPVAPYLASFVPFAVENKQVPFIKKMVKNCFEALISNHLKTYRIDHSSPIKVHAVGSIGYLFSEIWQTTLKENGFNSGKIIQRPAEALMKYHLKHSNLRNVK